MTCKRTARRPPRRLRLTLESLAFGGDAVGHAGDGRVVFVPGGAPGDDVEVEVEEEHKAWLRARLERVVAPGPARAEPPCPVYRAGCGGCQWQHVAVAEQRAAKEDIVRRALRKVTGAVEPIRAPGPELGWRRRARLRYRCVGPPGRGGAVVGYARQRSHELVDAPVCPQLEPALEAALGAVRRLLLARATGAGEVELLLGAGGAVQVALDGPGAEGLAGPAAALLGEAGITGVRAGGVVLGAETLELGDGPHPFRARADLFAQASAPGNALLRALVLEAAAALAGPLAGRRVLELHAGSGNLTRDLLAAGCRVVAVDEAGPAVALARANLAPFADRVTLEARPAGPPLPGGPFDLVLVDPPRTGLEPGLAAALAALPAPLVYVSCDPQTLARDLGLLGRPVPRVVPVDLMPQTFHVEIVASVAGP